MVIFLAAYAQAHEDRSCIGVDIVSERVARALRSGIGQNY